jgi:DNA-directed RNA polymerase specialized sigma24 family protein
VGLDLCRRLGLDRGEDPDSQSEAVLAAFGRLSDRDQDAIQRRIIDGQTWREMALDLGLTISGCQNRVDSALMRLKKELR